MIWRRRRPPDRPPDLLIVIDRAITVETDWVGPVTRIIAAHTIRADIAAGLPTRDDGAPVDLAGCRLRMWLSDPDHWSRLPAPGAPAHWTITTSGARDTVDVWAACYPPDDGLRPPMDDIAERIAAAITAAHTIPAPDHPTMRPWRTEL